MYNVDNYIISMQEELSAKNDLAKAKQLLQEKESEVMLLIANGEFKAKNAEERKAIIENEAANQIEYFNKCDEAYRIATANFREQEHYFELYKIDARQKIADTDLEAAKLNLKVSVNNLEASKNK